MLQERLSSMVPHDPVTTPLGPNCVPERRKRCKKGHRFLMKKNLSPERNRANLVTEKLFPRKTKSRKRNEKVKKNVTFWIRPTGSWKGALAEKQIENITR